MKFGQRKFSSITAYCMNKQNIDEREWFFSWAAWVGKTSQSMIQRILDKKKKKKIMCQF